MSKQPLVDFTYLDQMSAGDPASRRELLQMLIAELKGFPPRMAASLNAGDWDALQQKSHHFKSTLPFTGCSPLITANKELEQLSRTKRDPKRAAALLQKIEQLCISTLPVLEKELGRPY